MIDNNSRSSMLKDRGNNVQCLGSPCTMAKFCMYKISLCNNRGYLYNRSSPTHNNRAHSVHNRASLVKAPGISYAHRQESPSTQLLQFPCARQHGSHVYDSSVFQCTRSGVFLCTTAGGLQCTASGVSLCTTAGVSHVHDNRVS